MTKNVNYKECVCDICGAVEHIAQSLILPKGWDQITLVHKKCDVCHDCLIKVKEVVENAVESIK